jgi:cell division protein FtsB
MFTSKQPKSAKLAVESQGLLDVFTETKTKLQGVNEKIDTEDATLEQQIAALEQQRQQLAATKTGNERVIGNINRILE